MNAPAPRRAPDLLGWLKNQFAQQNDPEILRAIEAVLNQARRLYGGESVYIKKKNAHNQIKDTQGDPKQRGKAQSLKSI